MVNLTSQGANGYLWHSYLLGLVTGLGVVLLIVFWSVPWLPILFVVIVIFSLLIQVGHVELIITGRRRR